MHKVILILSLAFLHGCAETITLPEHTAENLSTGFDYIIDGRDAAPDGEKFEGGFFSYKSSLPSQEIKPDPGLLLNDLAKSSLPKNFKHEIALKSYNLSYDHNLRRAENKPGHQYCGTVTCEAILQINNKEIHEKKEVYYLPHAPILGPITVDKTNIEALQSCIDQTNKAIINQVDQYIGISR